MPVFRLIVLLIFAVSAAFAQSEKLVGIVTDGFQNSGRIFQVNPDGSSPTVVQTFPISAEGETPTGQLVKGPDGDLYGTMSKRGAGAGTFFKIKISDNSFHVLHSFALSGPTTPIGTITYASDGYFYGLRGYDPDGITSGVYKIKPDGSDYSFVAALPGIFLPICGLTFHEGFVYGMTLFGGIHGDGFVFRIDLSGNLETIHSFQKSVSGSQPFGKILAASDGKLYGLSTLNALNRPTIFRMNPDGSSFQTVLEMTTMTLGTQDFMGLYESGDGKLLGATGGKVFQLNKDGSGFTFTNVFGSNNLLEVVGNEFVGWSTDIVFRGTLTPLVNDWLLLPNSVTGKDIRTIGQANGYLYAITADGGENNRGTIFRLNLNPEVQPAAPEVLKSFVATDRGQRLSRRIEVLPDGNLLGVTTSGGLSNKGTVFTTKPDGSAYTEILNPAAADVNGNFANVPVQAADGFLYGVTSTGDIYRVSPSGNDFKRMYAHYNIRSSFETSLTAVDDWLYGVCNRDPFLHQHGFIYRVRTDGTGHEVLHVFDNTTGSKPSTRLIYSSDGFLYGGTTFGGPHNDGVIFKIKSDGTNFSVVLQLQFETTGGLVEDGMFFTSTGKIVGSARIGPFTWMIFSVDPNGTNYNIIHEFGANLQGVSMMAESSDGKLYGLEPAGGANRTGILYKMDFDGGNYTMYDLALQENPSATFPMAQVAFVPSKQQQTISFGALAVKNMGDAPFALTATATSTLPVSYTSSNTSVATISGSSVTIVGEGTTLITARQSGDNQYFSARQVAHTLRVGRIQSPVKINAPSIGVAGSIVSIGSDFSGPANLAAFSVRQGTGMAEVMAGNKLKLVASGTVTLRLTIAGNDDYQASTIDHEILIKKGKLRNFELTNLSWGSVGHLIELNTVHEPSQREITYTITPISGAAVITDDSKLELLEPGVVRLDARIEANAVYEASTTGMFITIHSSTSPPHPDQIYGIMSSGGAGNSGVLFAMNSDGTGYRALKHFLPLQTLAGGEAQLFQAADGKFYGSHSNTLFSFDKSTHEYKLIDGFPVTSAALTRGSDGNIYGATENSASDLTLRIIKIVSGTPSTVTANNTIRVGQGFFRTSLTEHSNGKFYGPANYVNGNVGIFEFDPTTGTITPKVEMAATNMPRIDYNNRFVAATNGKLYSITTSQSGIGGVVEYDPVANTLIRKVITDNSQGGFVEGENGKLLAVTRLGIFNYIVEYTPGATSVVPKLTTDEFARFSVGQRFTKLSANKYYIAGRETVYGKEKLLVYDAAMNRIKPTLELSTSSTDFPLTVAGDKLLQVWEIGGAYGDGAIVEIDPTAGTVNELHSFIRPIVMNGPDGLDARIGTDLYGVIGISNLSIYKFDAKTGLTTVVYTPDPPDVIARNSLIAHPNGKLYALQVRNITSHVLEFDPITKQSTISPLDGVIPGTSTEVASNYYLTSTSDGKIFGVSTFRNAVNTKKPVIFEFDLTTHLPVVLAELPGLPTGRFMEGPDHRLYGYCENFLVRFDPVTRTVLTVYEFTTPNGRPPIQVPFFSSDGKLYGTTSAGAVNARGALFEFDITTNQLSNRFMFTDGHSSMRAVPFVDGLNNTLIGHVALRSGVAGDLGYTYKFDKATNQLTFTNCIAATGSAPRGGMQRVVVKQKQYISLNEVPPMRTLDPPFQIYVGTSSGQPAQVTIEDTSVATVDNNFVTIVGAGTTKIIASQPGNEYYLPAESVHVELVVLKVEQRISFDQMFDKVIGDAPFQLEATSTSGLPVSYSTTSDKITINGPTITPAKTGYVTITAEQSGNDDYSAAEPVTNGFCINPQQPAITVNGMTLTSSSDNGNEWYLNDIKIPNAVSKTLTAQESGNYTVAVTSGQCSSERAENVAITGVKEGFDFAVSLFPNPASNNVIAKVTSSDHGSYNLSIKDALGRETLRRTLPLNVDEHIDVSAFAEGLYLVTIEHNNARTVQKLVVSK